jgi:hypothetical protein
MIFDIVKKVIDEWDPCGFLDMHAPLNEYDIESRMITARLNKNSSLEEINTLISEICTRMFNENFSREKCLQTAVKLKNNIDQFYKKV